MKLFIATENDAGVRLSRFVQAVTQDLPSSMLYKSFRNRRIKVNGKRELPEYRIAAGDRIELYINDEFFGAGTPPLPPPKTATDVPALSVVFEDARIAVLYKPAGLLCHSDATGDASLLDSFIRHLIREGSYRPDCENSFCPALCNRIDRGTEGLVLGAKSYSALRDGCEAIRLHKENKEYLCIATGQPVAAGIYTAYLTRDLQAKKVSVSLKPSDRSKEIRTEITPLTSKGCYTLYRVGLLTGRTHQIRAHLAFLGAPLLGDIKYGGTSRPGLAGQALCAYSIRFLDLPPENTLFDLSGRVFTCEHNSILQLMEHL